MPLCFASLLTSLVGESDVCVADAFLAHRGRRRSECTWGRPHGQSKAYQSAEEADIKVCYEEIRSWLVANGTIKKAKVRELCAITPKQASKIMDGFCEKYPVFVKGGGRSTVYI